MNPLRFEGLVTRGTAERWAVFSPDGLYRYAIGVTWNNSLPVFDICMLNPSRADERKPDPTFTRVMHFAAQEGCGAVLIRNLAARVETNSWKLWLCHDPIGTDNGKVLGIKIPGSMRVGAWGALDKRKRLRLGSSLSIARRYFTSALRVGKTGEPWHPLYLPNDTRIAPFALGPTVVVPT